MSPAFLHANSTSHVWPFSAIAEIIGWWSRIFLCLQHILPQSLQNIVLYSFSPDNAYDPDVFASEFRIDVKEINGQTCLTFLDNGYGLSPEKLVKMLRYFNKSMYSCNETDIFNIFAIAWIFNSAFRYLASLSILWDILCMNFSLFLMHCL